MGKKTYWPAIVAVKTCFLNMGLLNTGLLVCFLEAVSVFLTEVENEGVWVYEGV